jgi:tetratricopeptide (TPR) repeat protein
MMGPIILVAILIGAAWILWRRRARRYRPAASPASPSVAAETLALEAFAHGNTCLAEGRFDEAIAAFQRARELDPKRPHVAERLAEVARRQQAASPSPPPPEA